MALTYQMTTVGANSVNDVLDTIQSFLVTSNGWTLDYAGLRSGAAGKRLHLHITSGADTVYLNFGAYKGEARYALTTDNPISALNYTDHIVAMNQSTGFAGSGADWELQTGAPTNGGGKRCSVEMRSETNTAWPSGTKIHLFYQPSPVMFWCFVELATGEYQFLGAGLPTRYGTHSSGAWFTGSQNSGLNIGTVLGQNAAPGLASRADGVGSNQHNSYLYYSGVDATSGWAGYDTAGTAGAQMARGGGFGICFDPFNLPLPASMNTTADGPFFRSIGGINQLAQVLPIELAVLRNSGHWSPVGVLGNCGFVRMTYLTPTATYTFGSTTYRVMPFRKIGAFSDLGIAIAV